MSQPYVGEIRIFAGTFAPLGWAFCDGSLVAISEYETLFNLIGTTYGGDGQNTFALPDLRGRLPLHMGGAFIIGQSGGVEQVGLTQQQIPAHSHAFLASTDAGTQPVATGLVPASSNVVKIYATGAPTAAMAPAAMLSAGGNQPHSNVQPFLCVSFIISLYGIFPSPN